VIDLTLAADAVQMELGDVGAGLVGAARKPDILLVTQDEAGGG
jgi:hypothetical protein